MNLFNIIHEVIDLARAIPRERVCAGFLLPLFGRVLALPVLNVVVDDEVQLLGGEAEMLREPTINDGFGGRKRQRFRSSRRRAR